MPTATTPLRLHSGAPFWLLDAGLEEIAAPGGDCDVAIIGAGITGALLADRLAEAGVRVTVFDGRAPASGSTAASTALVQYELDVELGELIETMGEEDAVRAYRLAADAVGELAGICEGLGGCGFSKRPSMYLASRRRDRRRLEREGETRERFGFEAEFWTREAVEARYGFPSHGALRSAVAAELDPVRLTRALLRRAIARGAGLCSRTTVERVERNGSALTLVTSRGRVRVGRVIHATGYEVPETLPGDLVSLSSTYALVTEPLESFGRWDDRCLVWETARPYRYLRSTPDNRVIIGGLDVPFRNPGARDRLLPGKVTRLEKHLKALLPDLPLTTAYAWAGTFGGTKDGLPVIGCDEQEPLVSYALGYGGNGITFSVVAATILGDECLGAANADARIFRLDR